MGPFSNDLVLFKLPMTVCYIRSKINYISKTLYFSCYSSPNQTYVMCNDPMSYSSHLVVYAWPTNKEKDFIMHAEVRFDF